MPSPEVSGSKHCGVKVLHVAETLPGGIATYLREVLTLHLEDQAAADFRVLAPRDQLAHLESLPDGVLRGYSRSGRNLRSFWNLAVALRKQVREFRPQIVHLHSSFAGVVGRLLRWSFPSDVRVVYCPHGWAFARDDSRVSRLAYTWIERWLAFCTDAWVAISRYELDTGIKAGIRSDRACLVNNGIRDSRPLSVSANPAFDPAYFNLLFVGRHDRQKGLDILLSAMSGPQLGKVRLYVAGSSVTGDPIKQENTGNIFWLGWLAGSELVGYYRACDAVVVPSRWEGFGLVAVEAMAAGKAVIAARTGALSEIVDDGRTGRLVESGNAEAFARAFMQTSRDELQKWGAAGREKYVEKYDVSRTSRELSALYQRLIKNL